MLAILALSLAVAFLIFWRLGLLDELSRLLNGDAPRHDPEEERRLEVFKDFFSGETEPDE